MKRRGESFVHDLPFPLGGGGGLVLPSYLESSEARWHDSGTVVFPQKLEKGGSAIRNMQASSLAVLCLCRPGAVRERRTKRATPPQ